MSSSDPTRVKSNYTPHILRFYGKSNAASRVLPAICAGTIKEKSRHHNALWDAHALLIVFVWYLSFPMLYVLTCVLDLVPCRFCMLFYLQSVHNGLLHMMSFS